MIFETKVTGIGEEAKYFFEKGQLITFGEHVLETLKDFCCYIELRPVEKKIKPGQKFVIDGNSFEILDVGEIAEDNLKKLGHIVIKFVQEKQTDYLAGGICVKGSKIPELKVGTKISIEE